MYLTALLARLQDRLADERGDVPGWVLVTLMTAGLVVTIWLIAGDLFVQLFQNAINRVANVTGG
ncbi:MAG TPA: hypothetical protein VK039_03145 [Brevibacterium sp.]|nr:hypothetical protein [Brevibacterium sp.]